MAVPMDFAADNHLLKVVHDFVAAFDEGRIADAARFISDDCEILEAASLPYGGVWNGKEGFSALTAEILKTWDFHGGDWDNVSIGRSSVTLAGTQNMTSRATGRECHLGVVEIYYVRGSEIVALNVFYQDTVAIGHIIDPGAAADPGIGISPKLKTRADGG
jgi:uncharacterized protein